MGGRRWTPEEIEYLDDNRAYKTAESMAKKLGRSTNAVQCQMCRRALCSYRTASDWLTVYDIYRMIGIAPSTIKGKWQRKGLCIMRVGRYNMVSQDSLLRYLKAHPEDWNANAVNDDTIFVGVTWFDKIKSQQTVPKRNCFPWSQQDVDVLMEMRSTSCGLQEIADRLGRTKNGVKSKLVRMRVCGWKV